MDAPSEQESRSRRARWLIGAPLCLAAATATAFVVAQATWADGHHENGRSVSLRAQSQVQQGTTAGLSQTTSGKSTTSATRSEQAEAFSECMRSHGVKNFPGITITKEGQVQLNLNGSKVNPLSSTYKAAAKACASKLPAGSSLPDEPAPPSPSAPPLKFSCGSNCPTPPKAPELNF